MIAAVLALVAAQSGVGDGSNLQPASAAAIVAGGKACVGTTTMPADQAARLAGWSDATAAQKAGMKTDGQVVTRDNVIVIVKSGVDGGCVVQAKTAENFDKTAFLAELGNAVGAPIVTDPQKPVTKLPSGEILVTQTGGHFVQLVVANPNGKYAKPHSKGN